jgi:hypothetical protein
MAARASLRYPIAASIVTLLALLAALGLSPWLRPAPPPATTDAEPLALSESQRAYLWETEHHVNLLTQVGFKAVGQAIVREDRAELERICADSFVANVFEEPAAIRFEGNSLSLSRLRQDEGPRRRVDRPGFVAWLLELRQTFPQPPQARFDVMKMTPSSPDELTGTWTALCVVRLWGQSPEGALREVTSQWRIEVEQPTKERLAEPGWLLACTVLQVAAVASPGPLFRDVTAECGIDTAGMHDNWKDHGEPLMQTGGSYACDYNRDGHLDLFVTDGGPVGNCFFQGQGSGKFAEPARSARLPAEAQAQAQRGNSATIADLNNDGWEDLIIVDAGDVFANMDGTHFRLARESNLPKLVASWEMDPRRITGAVVADYDRDGLVDLYVTRSLPPQGSWLESTTPGAPPCRLLRNRGGFQFEDVTAAAGADDLGRSVFTAAWLYANDDLWPDLYLINEFGNGLLLENEQGRSFRPREIVEGPHDFGSMGLSCGDVDNDGRTDIHPSNMYSKAGSRVMANLPDDVYPSHTLAQLRSLIAGSELYLNRGLGGFERVGRQWQVHGVGWSWGTALADFNNDGWLDIYSTAGFISRDRSKPDG